MLGTPPPGSWFRRATLAAGGGVAGRSTDTCGRHEIQQGIGGGATAAAGRNRRGHLGVDFALLGSDGLLVDNPRHYRDARTNGMMEKLFEAVPRDEVFSLSGIQFMQFNTLFQLYAMKVSGSPALGAARTMLNMPTCSTIGRGGRSETTIASTTQFFDLARCRGRLLFDRLGLPAVILPEPIAPDAPRCSSCPTRRSTPPPGTTRRPRWPRFLGGRRDWCYILRT
jgi:hypothetical protein